jgi:hypothetical protein
LSPSNLRRLVNPSYSRSIGDGDAITQCGIINRYVDSTCTLCHGFGGFPFCPLGASGRSSVGLTKSSWQQTAQNPARAALRRRRLIACRSSFVRSDGDTLIACCHRHRRNRKSLPASRRGAFEAWWCGRRGSNPHSLNGKQIFVPLRLSPPPCSCGKLPARCSWSGLSLRPGNPCFRRRPSSLYTFLCEAYCCARLGSGLALA